MRNKVKSEVNHEDFRYFRWHDSGDLQSVQHLENIVEVARQMPKTKFWLPTREYQIVKDWFALGNIKPKNLVIRLSGHLVDGPLPFTLAKQLGVKVSGVHTKGSRLAFPIRECQAYTRGNRCGPCRACWDGRITAVSYPKH